MDLQQLLKQAGGATSGMTENEQWIAANEKHRALRDLLELELKKQQREEEAVSGVMGQVSGYGTPGQRAEQLYRPLPQLSSALSQFAEQGATPSFSDFGSVGKVYADIPGAGPLETGMRSNVPTTPESLTGIQRELYRKGAGLTGPDVSETAKRQEAHDMRLYERSLKDQTARDARLEKQQAQQTAENEKRAALVREQEDRKERAQFLYTNKQLYLATSNKQDDFYKQQLAILQADLGKALTKTDRARIADSIRETRSTWEAERRLRPSLGQIMREAVREYESIRSGKIAEGLEDDPVIASSKQAIDRLPPEDRSAIMFAYELTPDQIAAEAAKRGLTPDEILSLFLQEKRKGKSK